MAAVFMGLPRLAADEGSIVYALTQVLNVCDTLPCLHDGSRCHLPAATHGAGLLRTGLAAALPLCSAALPPAQRRNRFRRGNCARTGRRWSAQADCARTGGLDPLLVPHQGLSRDRLPGWSVDRWPGGGDGFLETVPGNRIKAGCSRPAALALAPPCGAYAISSRR